MAKQLFSNNATGVLTSNITATDTTIGISGAGNFPDPNNTGSGDWALATISEGSTIEIIRYHKRNSASLDFCLRGQEGTTPSAFTTAAIIECRNTAGSMSQLQDDLAAEVTTLNSAITAASPQITMPTTGSIPAGGGAVLLSDGTVEGFSASLAQATADTLTVTFANKVLTAFDPASDKILMYCSDTIYTGTISGGAITWNAGVTCTSIPEPTTFCISGADILISGSDGMGSGIIQTGTLTTGVPTMNTPTTFAGTTFESNIASSGVSVRGGYNVFDGGSGNIASFAAVFGNTGTIDIFTGLDSIFDDASGTNDLSGIYYFSLDTTTQAVLFMASESRGLGLSPADLAIHGATQTSSTTYLVFTDTLGCLDGTLNFDSLSVPYNITGQYLGSAVVSSTDIYVSTVNGLYRISSGVLSTGTATNGTIAYDIDRTKVLSITTGGGTLTVSEIDPATLGTLGSSSVTSVVGVGTLYPALGGITGSGIVFVPYDPTTSTTTLVEYAIVSPGSAGVSSLTADNFIGIAQSNTLSGNTVIDIVGGINTLQTGLTPGLKYFINADGSLTPNTGTAYAGLALSSTSLLIKG